MYFITSGRSAALTLLVRYIPMLPKETREYLLFMRDMSSGKKKGIGRQP
ncbi:MAG: hypothetical protein NTU62_07030 [Spirochaetes bacterium]|nr:hypothetical protein [Spirochaetota bacterium]